MLQTIHKKIKDIFINFQSLFLLLARFIVAYVFFESSKSKWSDIDATAKWFDSINIPLSTLNAYVVASVEALGVLLLTLGLFTRLISVTLMVIIVVAILTVHLPHGFKAVDNGFEIPLYYILFLFFFLSHGAGKFSLDYLIFRKEQ